MAIIGPCVYDAQGQLVLPRQHTIGRARIADFENDKLITADRGFVHMQTIRVSGVTADHARGRGRERLSRFFERVEQVTGYRKISVTNRQGVIPVNGNVTITYEVIYAIEPPRWARTNKPESPNAGSQRDRGYAARR